MSEPLTWRTRYRGRAWLPGSFDNNVAWGEAVLPGDDGRVELTFCHSCGSPVVVGHEDDHEVLHQ